MPYACLQSLALWRIIRSVFCRNFERYSGDGTTAAANRGKLGIGAKVREARWDVSAVGVHEPSDNATGRADPGLDVWCPSTYLAYSEGHQGATRSAARFDRALPGRVFSQSACGSTPHQAPPRLHSGPCQCIRLPRSRSRIEWRCPCAQFTIRKTFKLHAFHHCISHVLITRMIEAQGSMYIVSCFGLLVYASTRLASSHEDSLELTRCLMHRGMARSHSVPWRLTPTPCNTDCRLVQST